MSRDLRVLKTSLNDLISEDIQYEFIAYCDLSVRKGTVVDWDAMKSCFEYFPEPSLVGITKDWDDPREEINCWSSYIISVEDFRLKVPDSGLKEELCNLLDTSKTNYLWLVLQEF